MFRYCDNQYDTLLFLKKCGFFTHWYFINNRKDHIFRIYSCFYVYFSSFSYLLIVRMRLSSTLVSLTSLYLHLNAHESLKIKSVLLKNYKKYHQEYFICVCMVQNLRILVLPPAGLAVYWPLSASIDWKQRKASFMEKIYVKKASVLGEKNISVSEHKVSYRIRSWNIVIYCKIDILPHTS